jgi:hypothetical protein
VVQQRKEARARTVESRRTRREELRRKILVGAIVLHGSLKINDGVPSVGREANINAQQSFITALSAGDR